MLAHICIDGNIQYQNLDFEDSDKRGSVLAFLRLCGKKIIWYWIILISGYPKDVCIPDRTSVEGDR